MDSWICPYENGSLLRLYVQPGARSSGLTGLHGGRLKIKVSSPPREGEANREIIDFLSGILKIVKKDIEIVRGESGRTKDVYVNLPPDIVISVLRQLF